MTVLCLSLRLLLPRLQSLGNDATWSPRRLTDIAFCVAILLTAAFAASCADAQTPQSAEVSDHLEQIQSRLRSEANRDGIGSISAAIIIDGQVALVASYGCADCGNDIDATPSTIYRIGSVSKTITGTLLAVLVSDGDLGLDDRADTYIPEIRDVIDPYDHAADITLRQLANHTSGLAREPLLDGAVEGETHLWQSKLLEAIPTTSLDSTPGASYSYSNIGYALLGLAISRAVDEPYMQLVRTRIFEPFQMNSSTFVLSDSQQLRLAVGYDNSKAIDEIDTLRPAAQHQGRGYKVPNGGVYSTVGDLSNYVLALMGRSEQLTSENLELIFEQPDDITNDDGRGLESYGLGVRMHVTPHGEIISTNHGGTVPGYRTWIQFDAESGHAVVLVRNYNKGANELSDIADFLMRILTRTNGRSDRQ